MLSTRVGSIFVYKNGSDTGGGAFCGKQISNLVQFLQNNKISTTFALYFVFIYNK